MAIQVGELLIEMGVNMARLTNDMNTAKSQVARAMSDIERSVNAAKGVLGALGLGLAASGLTNVIGRAIDAADAMGKLAQRAGTTTEAFSALSYAASFSEVSSDDLATSFKFLTKSMVAATDQSSDMAKIFSALNIPVKDASGGLRKLDEVMIDFIGSVGQLPDGAQKVDIMTRVLGRSGASMTAFANEGAEGLKRLMTQSDITGNTISKGLAESADKFNDNMDRLKLNLNGFVNSTLPAVLDGLEKLQKLFGTNAEATVATPTAFFGDKIKEHLEIIKGLNTEIGQLDVDSINLRGESILMAIFAGRDTAFLKTEIEKNNAIIADYQKTIDQIKKTQEAAGLLKTPDKTALTEVLTPARQKDQKAVELFDSLTLSEDEIKLKKHIANIELLKSEYAGADLPGALHRLGLEFKLDLASNAEAAGKMSAAAITAHRILAEMYPDNSAEAQKALKEIDDLELELSGPELAAAIAYVNRQFDGVYAAAQRYGEEMEESAKTAKRVLTEVYPNEAAAQEFVDKALSVIGRGFSGPETDAILKILGEKFSQVADDIPPFYVNAAKSIEGAFKDTFRNVFDNGVKSFGDLNDKLLSSFKDILAEMAAAAIARHIVIPTVLGVADFLGASAGQQAGIAAGAGAPGATAGGAGIGAAVIGASVLYSIYENEQRASAQRKAEYDAMVKALGSLSTDIGKFVLSIDATNIGIKSYFDAITLASKNADGTPATGQDKVAAEKALFDAIKSRYDYENKALKDVQAALEAVAKQAEDIKKSVGQDINRLLGKADFRGPEDLAGIAKKTTGNLGIPSPAAYLQAQGLFDKLTALNSRAKALNSLIYEGLNDTPLNKVSDIYRANSPNSDLLKQEGKYADLLKSGQSIKQLLSSIGQNIVIFSENASLGFDKYRNALAAFPDIAKTNIESLSSLRSETLRWYDSVIAISNKLKGASASLQGVVDELDFGKLDGPGQLAKLKSRFESNYSDIVNTSDPDKLASSAAKLAAEAGPLLQKAKEAFGSTGGALDLEQFVRAALLDAKSEVDANTPDAGLATTQAVGILTTIDGSLSSLQGSIQGALENVKGAIDAGTKQTVEALKALQNQIANVTGAAPVVVTVPVTLNGKLISEVVATDLDSIIKYGYITGTAGPATPGVGSGGTQGGGRGGGL